MRQTAKWIAATLVLGGCSSVHVADSWKDPSFAGPAPHDVLVVGVASSAAQRQLFEDRFGASLQTAGVRAVPSHTITSPGAAVGQDQVREAVGQSGADAVIVTRLQRVDRRTQVIPSSAMPPYMGGVYNSGLYGWYGAYGAVPAQARQYDVFVLETTLWQANTGKVVWGATSEVFEPDDAPKVSAQLAEALTEKMHKDGVL